MITLDHVPSYSEIASYYGRPDADGDWEFDKAWWDTQTDVYGLPCPLQASWDKKLVIRRLRLHTKVGNAVVDALSEIRTNARDIRFLGEWNILGDALNLRAMKSSPYLSTHAYGIAIDLNNHKACWGCEPETQLPLIVEAFEKRGFVWGGRWEAPYKDPMHFQACGG